MQRVSRLFSFFLFLGFIVSLNVTSSHAQMSSAERSAAIRHMAQSGADHGSYFVPESGYGFGIFNFLPNQEYEVCSFSTAETANYFLRIGPNEIAMRHTNGVALAEYVKLDSEFNVLEYLSGPGLMNIHEQGIVNIFEFPPSVFYFIGPYTSAPSYSGRGTVGPAGGPATRALSCGFKGNANGSNFSIWFDLAN